MKAIERYNAALEKIPATGTGFNPYLLRITNPGVADGLSDEQILDDVQERVHGDREVSDYEIQRAINAARNTKAPTRQKRRLIPITTPDMLKRLIQEGQGITEEDLREVSPVSIPPATPERGYKDHAALLLKTLYQPEDVIFVGQRYDRKVASLFEQISPIGGEELSDKPFIIPNPLTGKQATGTSGKPSFRCDAAVKEFRFCMAEFDNISLPDQMAFWSAVALPIAALIYSGGKSIHAWIKVDGVSTLGQWKKKIGEELYKRRLVPMGVDSACCNASRLSRLPGHNRHGAGKPQKLLYLSPNPAPTPILEAIQSTTPNRETQL